MFVVQRTFDLAEMLLGVIVLAVTLWLHMRRDQRRRRLVRHGESILNQRNQPKHRRVEEEQFKRAA